MKKLFKNVMIPILSALLILPAFSTHTFADEVVNNGKVSTPTSSVEPGSYYKEQMIELGSATPNVKIYYTLDGSTPTKADHLYVDPIRVDKDVTIKAIAIRGNVNGKALAVSNGNTKSDVSIFTYTFVNRAFIASKFLSFTYKDMPYRLYVPENYDSTKSYPLVLFLHGGGERGNDNVSQLMANDGAVIWASPENQLKHPAFVLAPQARNVWDGGFGLTRDINNMISLNRVFEVSQDLNTAYEILQKVKSEYNIDSHRLYSTGLSQGGFGTYNLNMKYPDLFAAMVTISGGGDPNQAYKLIHKPLWDFHSEDDVVIPVSYSRNIITAIKNAGGDPIYTEYPAVLGYNHGAWVPAYENKEMIEWLFKQVKSN
ncbi:chitobiase/beta-hexosaminidase C-terminal domain-containing protein [Neobacillus drentensis]|uniref:chitobiase/beta-hexosaminidase C-terminal domain-containing protein n=1 Tax=Neobacillus drentensis TaxID=220684 RepID=UPI001F1FFDE2|nr:chitobiase/beta-hexosaminidase C-terminal domain-containing protein [Neobacillus drentensis]ULT57054.1 chitobiase/beta-hexosaminidase C-terminal domain-containing protein [Neobacillus drentensis]